MVRPFHHRLAKAFFAAQVMRILAATGGTATVPQHAAPANPQLAETVAGIDDWEPERHDVEPSADALTAEPRHGAVEMEPAQRLERATAAYDAAVAAEHTTALDPHSTESEWAEARMRTVDANHDLVNARAAWESADLNQRAILHESELAEDWARRHGLATAPDIFRDQAVFDLMQTEPTSLTDPSVSEMSREGGPFGGETSRPVMIDETLRPVVIGEDQRRVDYAATMFDAEPYEGLSAAQAGQQEGSAELERARLAHNEAWLRKAMSEGRLVIDTGPAESKVDYPQPTQGAHGRPVTPEHQYRESSAYEMERRITADYEHTIHPWEDMSRVPWCDQQGQLNVRTLDDTTREQLNALGIDPNTVRERPWRFTGNDEPAPAHDPAPPDTPPPSPRPQGPAPPGGSAPDREPEMASPTTGAETQHEQAAETQQEEVMLQQKQAAKAQQEDAARAKAQQEQAKADEQYAAAAEQKQTAKAQQEQAAKATAQQEQAAHATARQEQAAHARAQQEQAAKEQREQAAKEQQVQAAKATAQQEQAAKAQQTQAKAQQEQAAKAQAQQKQASTQAKGQEEQAAKQKQQAQKGHRARQQRDSARRGAQQPRPTQPAAKPPEKRPSTPQAGRQR